MRRQPEFNSMELSVQLQQAQILGYRHFKDTVASRNRRIRSGHLLRAKAYEVEYGGYALTILPGVLDPTTGEGSLIMLECRDLFVGDRVLDMGTGSGNLSILAAVKSGHIVAVDISPVAVECAQMNVRRHGLTERIDVRLGDLFAPLRPDEKFDLALINPPFLEGKPRAGIDRAMMDPEYDMLTRFLQNVGKYLTPAGRVLLCFGCVGDLAYLHNLIALCGFACSIRKARVTLGLQFFVYELTILPSQGG